MLRHFNHLLELLIDNTAILYLYLIIVSILELFLDTSFTFYFYLAIRALLRVFITDN